MLNLFPKLTTFQAFPEALHGLCHLLNEMHLDATFLDQLNLGEGSKFDLVSLAESHLLGLSPPESDETKPTLTLHKFMLVSELVAIKCLTSSMWKFLDANVIEYGDDGFRLKRAELSEYQAHAEEEVEEHIEERFQLSKRLAEGLIRSNERKKELEEAKLIEEERLDLPLRVVFDTNALMDNLDLIERLTRRKQIWIVVSWMVIEDLDRLKGDRLEARKVIRFLERESNDPNSFVKLQSWDMCIIPHEDSAGWDKKSFSEKMSFVMADCIAAYYDDVVKRCEAENQSDRELLSYVTGEDLESHFVAEVVKNLRKYKTPKVRLESAKPFLRRCFGRFDAEWSLNSSNYISLR